MTMIALGIALAKFIPNSDATSKLLATITGTILVAFGAFLMFYAIIRNFYMSHIIAGDDSMFILDSFAPMIVAVGILTISALSITIMFI